MGSGPHILTTIGNTPLVELRRIVPHGSARIVLKVESANPTGSMKDRVAQAMVDRAAADGRLAPGGTVVEYTGGPTSVGTDEANAMARRLARDEAVFGGTSTGANVVASLRVAARLGEGRTVATILVDSGLRYLSTGVFKERA